MQNNLQHTLHKVKDVIRLQNPAARNLAMDLGLLKSHTDYTRFIILGRSRTGSNFLRGLLDSHPGIVTLGEIFREADHIDFDHPQYPGSARTLSLYQTNPVRFLDEWVFRKAPLTVQAVGFKLFYYHATDTPFNQLWDYLKEHHEIHILHIKRRNILRTHLSREKAEKTGRWVNTSGEKEEFGPVELDFNECREVFERTRRWENDADQFFKDHPRTEIIYEELAHNYQSEISRIQRFLGLPEVAVQPQTHKQSQKPLSEAIKNFSELKQQFANTPWAEFFNE